MSPFEEFANTVVDTFAADCAAALRAGTAPLRIAADHVQAILIDLEQSSREHLNRSLDRASVYDRFLTLKKYYSYSADRNGQYVYFFLCSINSLPQSEREAAIFKATMMLTAAPEIAKERIGQALHQLCENGVQSFAVRQPLMVTR